MLIKNICKKMKILKKIKNDPWDTHLSKELKTKIDVILRGCVNYDIKCPVYIWPYCIIQDSHITSFNNCIAELFSNCRHLNLCVNTPYANFSHVNVVYANRASSWTQQSLDVNTAGKRTIHMSF